MLCMQNTYFATRKFRFLTVVSNSDSREYVLCNIVVAISTERYWFFGLNTAWSINVLNMCVSIFEILEQTHT